MNSHPFYAPPALSGSKFEDLLATFEPEVLPFKARLEQTGREEFHWRSDIVVGSGVGLLRARYSGDWSLSPESDAEALSILVPLSSGRFEAKIGVDDVTAIPETALVATAPRLRYIRMCSEPLLSNVTLMFNSAAVARTLSSMFESAILSKLELTPLFDLSTGPGVTFKLLAHTIAAGMHGERVLEKSPKSMALLIEAALRLIFDNVPHRLSARLHDRLVNAAPRHVVFAIDYMHANMHLPITMIDIAEAVGTNVRSLQTGFKQFRDTTPIAYLRRIRLQAVHAELSLPQNRLPIKAVALKWGFSHLGRFAAQYRASYGVHPSETAKRAQRYEL